MKKILFLITISVLLLAQQQVLAQRGEGHDKERWERYRSEKVAFLTTNLELSPEEAQQFWPVYNQMEKEKVAMHEKKRELEQKVRDAAETISDKEIVSLTREFASIEEKEGALTKKYNEEFLKILPPKKVLKLYKVEGEFRMHMFKKYRDRRGKENKRP